MTYERPSPLGTAEQLRAWVTERARFDGETPSRWMLEGPDRPQAGWWLTNKDCWNRELTAEFAAQLDSRWPRGRNRGLSYLSPAGVLDLVDPAGRTPAVREGKRLKRLDEERSAREFRLGDAAREAFEALEKVPERRLQREGHTCPPRATWDDRAVCPGCQALVQAVSRARRRAEDWIREPLDSLGGRLPRDAAAANDEGLAEALFALQGATGWAPQLAAARSA
jgi:hypothetical protein